MKEEDFYLSSSMFASRLHLFAACNLSSHHIFASLNSSEVVGFFLPSFSCVLYAVLQLQSMPIYECGDAHLERRKLFGPTRKTGWSQCQAMAVIWGCHPLLLPQVILEASIFSAFSFL